MRDTGAETQSGMDDIRAVLQRYRIPTFAYHTWSPARQAQLEAGPAGTTMSAPPERARDKWVPRTREGASPTPPPPPLATLVPVPPARVAPEHARAGGNVQPVPWSEPDDLRTGERAPLYERMRVSPALIGRLLTLTAPTVTVCEEKEETDDVLLDALVEENVPPLVEEETSTGRLGLKTGLKGFFLRGVVNG